MKDMITIQNLTKTYGKHRGVEDVTFSVREGEIFGFLGPNGAGKSTTIRSMLGLIKYDQGEIRINGLDSVKDREKILADIGYMPSEAWFYPGMKIREILICSPLTSVASILFDGILFSISTLFTLIIIDLLQRK